MKKTTVAYLLLIGIRRLTVPLILLLLFLLTSTRLVASIPLREISSAELSSLESFYHALNGTHWTYPVPALGNPWKFPAKASDPCSQRWYGLSCESLSTSGNWTITQIELKDCNLVGRLPPVIGNFSNMKSLVLSSSIGPDLNALLPSLSNKTRILNITSRNIIHQPIPSSIVAMTGLNSLELSGLIDVDSAIVNVLPDFLFTMTNLTNVDLSSCSFKSSIPKEIGNLVNLNSLDLSGNSLSGKLPDEIYDLINLRELKLYNNLRINGNISTKISQLSQLQHLDLSRCNFDGEFPSALGLIHSLLRLDISSNRIFGTIPQTFSSLHNLTTLICHETRISGTIEQFLFSPTIQKLVLSLTNVSGTLPSGMFSLARNLTYLDIATTRIYGTLPTVGIGAATALEQLILNDNFLSKSIPSDISSLKSLKLLALEKNYFTGSIPRQLSSLSNLERLYLDINALTNSIPHQLSVLTNLTSLWLGHNNLNSSIPSQLSTLISLRQLQLDNNFLTKSIPSQFSSLTNLRILYASRNQLIGTIMTTITSLRYLDLSFNSLNGPIPAEMSNIKHLKSLALVSYADKSAAAVEYTIPSELSALTELTYLELALNGLVGSIPPLPISLGDLSLQGNRLSNTIPLHLFNLTTLHSLNLQDNHFSGKLSENVGNIANALKIYLQNNFLTGQLPNSISKLTKLLFFNAGFNSFYGPIGNFFNDHPSLNYFDVESNNFFGCLTINGGASLKNIILSSNLLSCSIPNAFSNIKLQLLQLNSNLFEGSLPLSLSGSKFYLRYIDVSNNRLNGDPFFFANFERLEYVNISFNHFDVDMSGWKPCDGCLSNSFNAQMQILDIGYNLLKGSLPDSIATMFPLLIYLAAGHNCLNSYIPQSFCDLSYIEIFSLNKLGSECKFTESDVSFNVSYYSLPTCLMSLPTLEQLNFASNKLYGTLGEITGRLQSLYGNSNQLFGTIPISIQTSSNLTTLSLSFNRLSGVLAENAFEDLPVDSTIELFANRLSGDVPSSLYKFKHINVLVGNVFECLRTPAGDVNSNDYMCASQGLVASFYTCFAIVIASLFLIKFGMNYCRFRLRPKHKFLRYFEATQFPNKLVRTLFKPMFVKISLSIACILFVLNMSMSYSFDGDFYNSYNTVLYQYQWSSTFAFIHGIIPYLIVSVALYVNLFSFLFISDDGSSFSGEANSRDREFLKVPKLVSVKTAIREPHALEAQSMQLQQGNLPVTVPAVEDSGQDTEINEGKSEMMIMPTQSINVLDANRESYARDTHCSLADIMERESELNQQNQAENSIFASDVYRAGSESSPARFSHQNSQLPVTPAADSSKDAEKGVNIGPLSKRSEFFTWLVASVTHKGSIYFMFLQLLNIAVVAVVNLLYVEIQTDNISFPNKYQVFVPVLLGVFKLFWNNAYIAYMIRKGVYFNLSQLFIAGSYVFASINLFFFTPIITNYLSDWICFYYAWNPEKIPAHIIVYPMLVPDSYCLTTPGYLLNHTISVYDIQVNGTIGNNYCIDKYKESSISRLTQPNWTYSHACGSAFLINYIPVVITTYFAIIAFQIFKLILLTYDLDSPVRNYLHVRRILPLACKARRLDTLAVEKNKNFRTYRTLTNLIIDVLMMFTFGLACPLLTFLIILKLFVTEIVNNLQIGEFVCDDTTRWGDVKTPNNAANDCDHGDMRSSEIPDPSNTCNDERMSDFYGGSKSSITSSQFDSKNDHPSVNRGGDHPTLSRSNSRHSMYQIELFSDNALFLFFAMWKYMLITILIFWSIINFDMIADVYMNINGIIAVIIFWLALITLVSKNRLKEGLVYVIARLKTKTTTKGSTDRPSNNQAVELPVSQRSAIATFTENPLIASKG